MVCITPFFSSSSFSPPPLLQASQPDELTIEEQEVLEVIDDGDMEDWVKVRDQDKVTSDFPRKKQNLNPCSHRACHILSG